MQWHEDSEGRYEFTFTATRVAKVETTFAGWSWAVYERTKPAKLIARGRWRNNAGARLQAERAISNQPYNTGKGESLTERVVR